MTQIAIHREPVPLKGYIDTVDIEGLTRDEDEALISVLGGSVSANGCPRLCISIRFRLIDSVADGRVPTTLTGLGRMEVDALLDEMSRRATAGSLPADLESLHAQLTEAIYPSDERGIPTA